MENIPAIERFIFLQELSHAIDSSSITEQHMGLVLVDLSNLARVNHRHGYHWGDRLLIVAYEQLLGVSKLPNAVFRIGDHRFAFILKDLVSPAFITLAMNRITRLLEQALHTEKNNLETVEINLGIAVGRHGECDALGVLASAEMSLARVKKGQGYSIEDIWGGRKPESTEFDLEHAFVEALQNNGFELYFQPQVNLNNGEVEGAEALLRWFPDGQAPVSPEVVVSLAEVTNRDYELTKWLMHSGLRQLKDWEKAPWDIRLSLNVEAGMVGSADLPTLLRDALSIWGVQSSQVMVEITESALIEDKDTGFSNLTEMRDLGIQVSIDDFGTGYSSLSYFKHIPANELKIDKSFVTSMMTDEQDLELVKVILQLAHQFGLKVVAEGVEDEKCLKRLIELGCDYAQGYYFSKPLSITQFEQWLQEWRGLPAM